MKYNAPVGAPSDAPYINGNRSAGIRGSTVPAEAVEFAQREIVHVIEHAGLTPDNTDLEQLRKAIQSIVESATGEGDTSQYLLLPQARARLPIFPEVQSGSGVINVSSPASSAILVPPGVSFLHRGIFPVSTSDYPEQQRLFTTSAGRTYHLRWRPLEGFVLKDVADPSYNPTAVAETNKAFDSSYDDMLVARVVTSASNIATVTNLANKNVLSGEFFSEFTFEVIRPNATTEHTLAPPIIINWARTPIISLGQFGSSGVAAPVAGAVDFGVTGNVNGKRSETTRYATRTAIQGFNPTSVSLDITAHWQVVARA